MPKTGSATPKTGGEPKLRKVRRLIARGLPPTPGITNLIVVKSGAELRATFQAHLEAMKRDQEKVEFFWDHLMKDMDFHDSKEFREYGDIVRTWELQAGIKDLIGYRARMRRFETLIEHFKPEFDYELTVQEVAEAVS